jgi:hypothetical protein
MQNLNQGGVILTVLELDNKKLLISLTHIEVLSCFYSYERLNSLSHSVKMAISLLILGVADQSNIKKGIPLSAKIKVLDNRGCEITVTPKETERKRKYKTYQLDFACNEDLTGTIIMLYRRPNAKRLFSSIYKTENGYRLIIKTKNPSALYGTDEFYRKLTVFSNEYTESGKLLLYGNAILKYGKIFSKGI